MTKLQSLLKLQNRAARIVVKSSFDAPAMPIIRNLNWRTVDDKEERKLHAAGHGGFATRAPHAPRRN